MKVIDGLELAKMVKENQLAEGTKVKRSDFPTPYYYKNKTFQFFDGEEWQELSLKDFFENIYYATYEITEEEKEIEEINYYPIRKNEIAVDYIENNETKHFCLNKKEKYFADKINELVREVRKLKKEGK